MERKTEEHRGRPLLLAPTACEEPRGPGLPPVLSPGQLIGNYRVVGLLGQGGMALVYAAVHQHLGRRVAIKVALPELSSDPMITQRLLNEARAVNRVQHPGLVQIHEFGLLPSGPAFIIMELLLGESLAQRIARAPERRCAGAMVIGRQIAAALAAAHHKGVVHRDLKPDNVMLVPDPDAPGGACVKVIDFGLAKISGGPDSAHPTRAGVRLGTPLYMAPEQCLDAASAGAPADVYALGVVLYEMLAGRPPFQGEVFDLMARHVREAPPLVRVLCPAVDPSVEALVGAMLGKREEERPPMKEVAVALERLGPSPFRAGVPAAAPPAPEASLGEDIGPRSAPHVPTQVLWRPAPARSSAPTIPLAAGEAGAQRSPRLLLVDDERDLTAMLQELLTSAGYHCAVVNHGDEALPAFRAFRPDVVVLDVDLPGASGYKLCWEIKSEAGPGEVPVVLLSAKSAAADHKLGMSMNADAYLDKPFQFPVLLGLLDFLLGRIA